MSSLDNKSFNVGLIATALLIGGLTYFYLGKKSDAAAERAVDDAVEVIAKETNQRPKTEIDLQKEETSRAPAAVDKSALGEQQSKLNAFAKSEFTDPSLMLGQVEKLSFDLLKSDLPMEKKSELNARLHDIASGKMAKINPPKVIDTKLDQKDNVIYPVFESK